MNLRVLLPGIAMFLLASRVEAAELDKTEDGKSANEATYEFVLVEPSGRLRAKGQSFWLKGIKLPRTTICRSSSGRPWGCGTASFVAWSQTFMHGPVVCTRDASRADMRSCSINSQDVAAVLLASGWGVRDKAVSSNNLERAENEGKQEKRGIWSPNPF